MSKTETLKGKNRKYPVGYPDTNSKRNRDPGIDEDDFLPGKFYIFEQLFV